MSRMSYEFLIELWSRLGVVIHQEVNLHANSSFKCHLLEESRVFRFVNCLRG